MLVSILLCSEPHIDLGPTIESVRAQDVDRVELVVVDRTGLGLPALAGQSLPGASVLRVVGRGRPLGAAEAANLGLLSACGEWIAFIDAGGRMAPGFLRSILDATQQHDDCLAVYGSVNVLDGTDGGRRFAAPFNRARMFDEPLFATQAALVRRGVIGLGCRFDEALGSAAERDFFAQIAQYTDLALVNVDAGSIARDPMPRRDDGAAWLDECRLRNKWAGAGIHAQRRVSLAAVATERALWSGDEATARATLSAALREFPDSATLLVARSRLELRVGQHAQAVATLSRAVAVSRHADTQHLELAWLLARRGDVAEARRLAQACLAVHRLAAPAGALLRQLAEAPDSTAMARTSPMERAGTASVANRAEPTLVTAITKARTLFEAGEADAACAALEGLDPAQAHDHATAANAGIVLLESGHYVAARPWLLRAVDLDGGDDVRALLQRCADQKNASVIAQSVYREVAALMQRLREEAAPRATDATIHIVASLSDVGGSERHALNLFRELSTITPTTLWSTRTPLAALCDGVAVTVIDAAAGRFPQSGTLVLIGQFVDIGQWIGKTAFQRVIIRYNLDHPDELLERMTDLEWHGLRAPVELNYPSAHFEQRVGLPGFVERAMPDLGQFAPFNQAAQSMRVAAATPVPLARQPFIVGRHSRDDVLKHHPNDPSFFRRLTQRGVHVRLMGASVVADALARGTPDPRIEIFPVGALSAAAFLATLDCFVYRSHPRWYETGGNVLAEAMAMALPVIVFGDRIGFAEVIESGRNGFRVDSEDEALAIIEQLANSPALCREVGARARETLLRLQGAHRDALRKHYVLDAPLAGRTRTLPAAL